MVLKVMLRDFDWDEEPRMQLLVEYVERSLERILEMLIGKKCEVH